MAARRQVTFAIMTAASSASELSRLGKLAEYQILDTSPEREFDEITEIAAKLIGVPILLVSLIDKDRQWFKARYGLGATETPREHAFCAHAIKADDVYVVNDATQNPLFAENPLVTGAPDIRFYAGAPRITPDKFRLGTLCVIDTKPREISADAQKILELLARAVVNALESRRQVMRAQHQVRMMTRLAEATVAVSQGASLDELSTLLTTQARSLVVADVAYLSLAQNGAAPRITATARDGTPAQAAVAWEGRGLALMRRDSLAPATLEDISGQSAGDDLKGAWIGFTMGLDAAAPLGHLQIWRKATSSFTDLEAAMLTDLARVASAAVARLTAH